MRVKYKQWAVDYIDQNKTNQFDLLEEDKEKLSSFINSKKTYIEIGPGKGDFIINLANKYSEFNFIVIELNKTVSGICLKAIDDSGLENVRLVSGDFYKFVDQIENKSIEGIFLNFSDPWPKKKHTNRRLTSERFLLNYSYILKDDGLIYQKTDNVGLFDFSIEMFETMKWELLEKTNDYNVLVEFDSQTEFEKKFRNQGIKINRLVVKKTKDTLVKEAE